jgi:Tfp pilus assembly protein PilX
MKRTRNTPHRSKKGYALLITIVFIGIALLLLASVLDWSASTARQTERNNLFSSATAAAEAATERVLAEMSRDFYSQTFKAATNYSSLYPTTSDQANWPVRFSFSNGSGGANQTGVSTSPNNWTTNWVKLGNQYAGLWATVAQCTVVSTATALNQPYTVPATVQERFQLASIPLFQFAIFYNRDLEISPGADMIVNGRTHVNGDIWASPSGHLTFGDTAQATGNYYNRREPNDFQANGSGTVTFDAKNSQGYYAADTNAASLTLPVGTNSYQLSGTNNAVTNSASSVAAILDLPPAGTDPNSQVGQTYLYNQADIVISNSSSGIISAFYQNSNNVKQLTPIPYDMTNVAMGVTNKYYTFATNVSFYDYRESDTVKAVQLDVGALNTWLSGKGATYNSQNSSGGTSKGHSINSVYVYNNASFSSSQLPAVRVANGTTLPTQGLTVASPFPMYVLGNYNASSSNQGTTNVAGTAPAAFIADAITVLSSGWKDSYTSSTSLNSRTAANTTINAATMEGIVETTNVGGGSNGGKRYSGGVENFLRLLESWSNKQLTYNGSIVVMFDSRYATNYWQSPGVYYNIPTRKWGFDVNFQDQNKLPPMTPQAKALVRQSWSAY